MKAVKVEEDANENSDNFGIQRIKYAQLLKYLHNKINFIKHEN